MAFRNEEAKIRKFSTDDIQWHLRENQDHFSKSGLFVMCDELLLRRIKITGLMIRFESLVRHLPTKILRYVDLYDERFSQASVHVAIKEMKRRGTKVSRWLLKVKGVEKGPFDRLELETQVKDLEKGLVWKEGMTEWKPINEMTHLKESVFYDQELFKKGESTQQAHDSGKKSNSTTSTSPEQSKHTSALVIAAGILTLATFPLWMFGMIAIFFSDVTDYFGPLLPFAFSLFMMLMAIPLGIGILSKKHWAWTLKIATSGVVSAWFISNVFLEGTNFVGLVFALFEIIILVLLLAGKDKF